MKDFYEKHNIEKLEKVPLDSPGNVKRINEVYEDIDKIANIFNNFNGHKFDFNNSNDNELRSLFYKIKTALLNDRGSIYK
tara:strand:- start:477 stop:716 length:240 start_codon:yes stop_codon:yes gene_type:complete